MLLALLKILRRLCNGIIWKIKRRQRKKRSEKNIDRMMKDYSKGKIDGDTYFKQMMDYTTSHRDKKKK